MIVFQRALVGGAPTLYTVNLRGQLKQLTVGGWAGNPAWAPDGRRLAAWLHKARVLPGGPEIVRPPVRGDTFWSPNGHELVGDHPQFEDTIAIGDLKTGSIRTIYADDGAGSPAMYDPDWAPNGREIALAYEFGGNEGIAIIDVATRRIRVVASGLRPLKRQAPAWSPDGTKLAFATSPGWTPAMTRSSAIYVSRADGKNAKLLARNASNPAWSPDGRLIAFVRAITRTNTDIFVMNADGTRQRRLTRSPRVETAPDWQRLRAITPGAATRP